MAEKLSDPENLIRSASSALSFAVNFIFLSLSNAHARTFFCFYCCSEIFLGHEKKNKNEKQAEKNEEKKNAKSCGCKFLICSLFICRLFVNDNNITCR